MGTRAFFSITDNTDHIPLYTRWDGFEEEIKADILELDRIHQSNIDVLKNNFNLSPFMTQWFIEYQELIQEYKNNPNVSLTAKLLSMLSFVHSSPEPIFKDKDTLSFDNNSYDFNFNIKTNKKSKNAKINLHINEIKNFKILRVYHDENIITTKDSLDNKPYIDLKFKNIDNNELAKQIHLLPFFIRDFHVSFLPFYKKNDFPFIKLLRTISNFYNDQYQLLSYKEYKKTNSFEDEKKMIEDKFEHARSMIPFDLYLKNFCTHLFLRFPTQVEPLTYSEAVYSNAIEPDVQIFLCGNRFYYIGSNTEKSIIEEEAKKQIKYFQDKHNPKIFTETEFNLFHNGFTYTHYEQNCIVLLNELSGCSNPFK